MVLYRFLLFAWALLFGLLAAWNAAEAGPPTEQLRPAIERVVKVLEDPALKSESRAAERKQAVREAAETTFDWPEMARRALGQHWPKLAEPERQEFVGLFRTLLEKGYVSKIDRYSGEKVVYAGETIDGDMATVKTKIMSRQGQEIPVEYRMIKRGDKWLVYDVIVEGVGLVSNYRTQFNEIIRTSSYQDLLKRLRSQTS
ncbi:MAG TPA: ABC transporter substrate-binding protein [Candidatus Limnocylindrales bacterium]|nr:ABC transporter substrate-binding protein [Candidatus Limnocylindrales bacterium]